MRFEHTGPAGDPAQPENVVIASQPWVAVDRVRPEEAYARLSPHLVSGPDLLGDRGRVVREVLAQASIDASLALVEPEDLVLSLDRVPWNASGSPRAAFYLGEAWYDLPLSEFVVAPRLRAKGFGEHSLADIGLPDTENVLLTVSLAEPMPDRLERFKLVAAVLPLP